VKATVKTLEVEAPGGGYLVHVGPGARARLRDITSRPGSTSPIHLIVDAGVAPHHGKTTEKLLLLSGRPVFTTVVPSGETSKSIGELGRLWRAVVRKGCDRDSSIVALGGGVVGDLAGFTAATVLRGIEVIQVPTTLLAMVDASVGGKTGINLPEGKNLVGSFHQPSAVVMDLDVLSTLPRREARAGWAEVIKTSLIRDASLLEVLEKKKSKLLALEKSALGPVIETCVRIKADVVARDDRELGPRRILNFGHTLAHGLEAVTRYGRLLHGEAVAIGMVFAAELGEALGRTEPGTARRVESLLAAYGLPTRPERILRPSARRLIEAMSRDKKMGPRGIRWVFLERVGEAIVSDGVPRDLVEEKLASFFRYTGSPPARTEPTTRKQTTRKESS
jgi:3-dehydroquinate synthase